MLGAMFAAFDAKRKSDPQGAVAELFERCGEMGRIWRKLETSGKPYVCAINGTCMGGGFELALACHGRVAAQSAKMGLPEVKVGIFPGAGGTQRVPRLADTQSALQMLLKGETLTAAKAKGMKLIDEVVPDDQLIEAAKAMLKAGLKPVKAWDEKGFKLPSGPVYSPRRAGLARRRLALPQGDRRQLSRRPRHREMRLRGPAGSDRHGPPDRAALLHRSPADHRGGDDDPLAVRLDAGAEQGRAPPGRRARAGDRQGRRRRRRLHGRRHRLCRGEGGIEVVLVDRDQTAADKGKAHSAGLMEGLVKKGRAKAEEAEALLARITATPTTPRS